MQDVTPLAERGEVPWAIVRRIMIEVRSRQDHARRAGLCGAAWGLQACHRPSLAISPSVPLLVPPAPISEVLNGLAVGSAAVLAPAPGTPEPDRG